LKRAGSPENFVSSIRQRFRMRDLGSNGTGMYPQARRGSSILFYTKSRKGTGLGLSIVYGIVKQHNGFISAYSEIGVGTTFHIYLPVVDQKARGRRPKPARVRKGSGTILLAEDNPEVRRLAKSLLMRTGYRVIEAANGEEAVDAFIANQDSVDLVIVDVVMPRKNGIEVIDEVRALKPDIKVLFTSGYTRDILSDKGICETGFDFLAKPLSPHELLQKIQDIMEG